MGDFAHVPFELRQVSLRSIALLRTTDAVRFVQEVFAIAERCFSILVDSDYDRLDVLIAPSLARSQAPDFGERFIQGGLSVAL